MGCSASSVKTVSSLNSPPSPPRKPDVTPTAISNISSDSATIRIKKRDRTSHPQEIVQNFLLIWLDEKLDESSDDCRSSVKQLRRTVNTIEIFHDTDECIAYMAQFQNEKTFLILSGSLCERVVPRIHDMNQLYSIYVFCRKQSKYEEWAKNWSKIKGTFVEIDSICESIRQTARQCDEDSIVISGLPSLNQIEPSFMYTQLLKEVILEIDFNEKKEMDDLVEYARVNHIENEKELKIIDEFAKEYQGNLDGNNQPVYWYTRECFTYRMLNKALGTLKIETLLKMSIFLRDLHINIKKLHSDQIQDGSSLISNTSKVYRGKTMTKRDFQSKIQQGGLMSFNNFLSTSNDRNSAIEFIANGLKNVSENKIGVLFEITLDRSISSAPFASICGISYFPAESEILFSTHTVFRVEHVEEVVTDTENTKIKVWQVKLTFTTESDDQQLSALTKHLREEITGTGWQQLGLLLLKLGANDKAEEVYTMLLKEAPSETDQAYCFNQFGSVYRNMGEYSKALSSYEQSLKIRKIALPPNHPDLATSYNNIASVYGDMGEYSKALSSYEQSLEIRKIVLPSNHPDFATSYNNIASAYKNMGEYSKALSSYEQSVEIRKIALPPNHPDLATSYNNIASVYGDMGEYSKALSSYEQSLEIRKIVLPPNHPDFATSYNNIASAYKNMGEYSKALSSYEQSFEIMKIALPPNHPDLATSYNNIGSVYDNMGEYSKALSSYEQSVEIRKIALPPNHPDLATSYNNIGLVYDNMGEHSKALSSHEQSLEIRKIALPPSHPDLATSYNNIGSVYDSMGEHSKALSYYEKDLEISRKALPSNHPDLATSYNNIGSACDNMGDYPKALSYYEKAQEIWLKSLPPTHPYIKLISNNIRNVRNRI